MATRQEIRKGDPDSISKKEMRRRIFAMVWPATIESLLQMTVGMVSSAMLGRVGAIAIGAVGLGRRITMLVWGFFAAIGTGTTVMVARSIGAEDRAAAGRYAEQAFYLALGMVFTFATVTFFFAEDILVLLYKTSGELLEVGTTYLRIVIWGVPFMAVMQITGAIMRGAGNTKVPMQIATVINLVNVALSYVLIFGHLGFPPLGVVGAAWASNIAQAVGAILALYIMLRRQEDLVFRLRGFRFVAKEARAVLGIGLPTAAENILMQLGQIMLTSLVVSFGTIPLAAHQQGITAESLSYMPAVGFGIAATAFVGQSMGAGSTKLAERYVRELAKWSMALTAVTASFLIFTPRLVFSLLTDVQEVIDLGAYYLIMMGIAQIPQQLTSIFNGALRGAGDTKAPMVIGAIGLWGVRLPFSYYLSLNLGWGILGVWAAMTLDLFVRFTLSATRFLRGRWKQQLTRMTA
ncbi:MAG: MATE family efflux transporter [Firmicutes bacterium]|nr:MATE family efflux transporter [Bacillota bacterium]